MDFTAFLESEFYKKASYHYFYQFDTDTVRIFKGNYAIITVNMLTEQLLKNIQSRDFRNIYPELYYLLGSSKLDPQYRNLIIQQWLEVNSHINTLNVTPHQRYLFILPANMTIVSHSHNCLSTLSFIYYYNREFDPENIITVSDIEYVLPHKEKLLLNMVDNATHSAKTNSGIMFIWVNDFNDAVKLSEITTQTFAQLNPN